MIRDLRYAIRSLWREKGYAATVALTLAVCIAANTAAFAIVDAVLLRPLPVPNANEILLISNQYPKAGVIGGDSSSAADYYERLTTVPALRQQAMFRSDKETLSIEHTPQQVSGMAVTPSFFPLVGVNPARGRAFTPEEGETGAEQKVILSDALWQNLYGRAASAIGQQIRLSGRPFTIVGVMPNGFNFTDPEVRYWIPLAFNAKAKTQHHNNNWHHIGRLAPGATMAQAQAQVDALNAANLDRFPEFKTVLINAGFHSVAEPLQKLVIKDVAGSLYLLWGGAGLVLLIGAVNLANVAVARWTVRRKEVATRLALGGSRTQLAKQFLSESAVIAMAGGAAGIALAITLLRTLAAVGLDRFPRASEVRIDGTAVLIAIGLSLLVGAVMGLAPFVGLIGLPVSSALHEDGRTRTSGVRARGFRQVLVGAEVGFAFVLLTGAALLLTSFRNLMAVDSGFSANQVLTASTNAPRARYADDNALRGLMTRTLAALRQAPGVASVGVTTSIPLGGDYGNSVILAEGYAMKPGESVVSPFNASVSTGYMETMKIGLVQGRYFNEGDTEASERVIVVDETLAKRFWPDRDPIGRRMFQPNDPSDLLKIGPKTVWLKVVGVVRSVRQEDLAGIKGGAGAYYFPYAQDAERSYTFVIRPNALGSGVGSGVDVERILRTQIAKIDPEQTVFDIKTMVDREELSVSSRRTAMMLSLGFSAVALLLSAIGIYGVLAYLVTQRRREIGIRMALGSTAAGVVRMVLNEGLKLVAGGLVAGLIGFAALQKTVASQVYGVQPLDPLVIGTTAGLLGLVALAACLLPAKRAAAVNPAIVLTE